jgi:hypothetical protein
MLLRQLRPSPIARCSLSTTRSSSSVDKKRPVSMLIANSSSYCSLNGRNSSNSAQSSRRDSPLLKRPFITWSRTSNSLKLKQANTEQQLAASQTARKLHSCCGKKVSFSKRCKNIMRSLGSWSPLRWKSII